MSRNITPQYPDRLWTPFSRHPTPAGALICLAAARPAAWSPQAVQRPVRRSAGPAGRRPRGTAAPGWELSAAALRLGPRRRRARCDRVCATRAPEPSAGRRPPARPAAAGGDRVGVVPARPGSWCPGNPSDPAGKLISPADPLLLAEQVHGPAPPCLVFRVAARLVAEGILEYPLVPQPAGDLPPAGRGPANPPGRRAREGLVRHVPQASRQPVVQPQPAGRFSPGLGGGLPARGRGPSRRAILRAVAEGRAKPSSSRGRLDSRSASARGARAASASPRSRRITDWLTRLRPRPCPTRRRRKIRSASQCRSSRTRFCRPLRPPRNRLVRHGPGPVDVVAGSARRKCSSRYWLSVRASAWSAMSSASGDEQNVARQDSLRVAEHPPRRDPAASRCRSRAQYARRSSAGSAAAGAARNTRWRGSVIASDPPGASPRAATAVPPVPGRQLSPRP